MQIVMLDIILVVTFVHFQQGKKKTLSSFKKLIDTNNNFIILNRRRALDEIVERFKVPRPYEELISELL